MIDRRALIALLAALVLATSAGALKEPEELTVFTAASLTEAFTEIGQMYEDETDIRVVFNFDGSQMLRTQIENGAYADIFVSANIKQLNALKNNGYLNNSTISIFTENRPALIVPRDNPANIHNVSDLARPGIKIVIGVKEVPIGGYALQILDKLANDTAYGLEFRGNVMANVVSNETNVNYIVSKVALGEADAGIAYKSDATGKLATTITMIEIPDEYNVIAEYPMGILRESKYPAGAVEFVNLVKSDAGRAVLEKYGFDPV